VRIICRSNFFQSIEKERLNCFPDNIEYNDLITFFTLSDSDKAEIPIYSSAANRLGYALQLCALRFMGFFPDNLRNTSFLIVEYVANQINVNPVVLAEYGSRAHTRTDHQKKIMTYLGYRRADEKDFEELSSWLVERALEHDKPSLLYELICEKLRKEKIIRPGITTIERLIAVARQKAETETMKRMKPILQDKCKSLLDGLLITTGSEKDSKTLLSWLGQSANSNSPQSILSQMARAEGRSL